jgi:hypothetical protein
MERPKAREEMRDFPGIFIQVDPYDLPQGGGQDQLNVKSDEQGKLSVRMGMLPVSFDYSA